jgi:UDP-glucose 4-epimerase
VLLFLQAGRTKNFSLFGKAMRVLITGNKGFIGRRVEQRLTDAGYDVIGYDVADGFDILNPELLGKRAEGCNAIVHLAAIEGQSDARVMETNLVGTWNVLQAGSQAKVEKIIFMSSVDVLGVFQGEGIPKYLPLDDDYPCHPSSTYAISKKLAEDMCSYFSKRSQIPVICFRPPGVWDETTYLKITNARKKRPEYEWDPYWEYSAFLDVRDLAEAIVLALKKDVKGFHSLLLSSDDITTSGMTSLGLVKKLLPGLSWKGGPEYTAEPFSALVKTKRAREVLGWSPRYSWREFQQKQK